MVDAWTMQILWWTWKNAWDIGQQRLGKELPRDGWKLTSFSVLTVSYKHIYSGVSFKICILHVSTIPLGNLLSGHGWLSTARPKGISRFSAHSTCQIPSRAEHSPAKNLLSPLSCLTCGSSKVGVGVTWDSKPPLFPTHIHSPGGLITNRWIPYPDDSKTSSPDLSLTSVFT